MIRNDLRTQLISRGFSRDGQAPNGTMSLDDAYLDGTDIGELLDQLVARREKVFRSSSVVGEDVAKRTYDDVVSAIEAIKAVLKTMTN